MRPGHDARNPLHVTLRVQRGLPSLRAPRVFPVVRTALARASGATLRILHFSVQATHVHLLVEAEGRGALSRGLQGLAIRVAKAVNRVLQRRGSVWAERYHAHALRTPREVRHALVYVLQNWKKHFGSAPGLDPCSSAAWFTGWRKDVSTPAGPSPVVMPRSWLAAVGWRRHGLLEINEGPATRAG